MIISQPLPVEEVNQFSRLQDAVQAMAGSGAIALDTESNSFDHYPEQLCLIQIATGNKIYIIDTISLKNTVLLGKVLSEDSIIKVIHGADYDIRCLDRHAGFRLSNLYDTSIAARFSGITRFGLADLIEELMGIKIQKSKRLQRANWGRRPLSAEAINYAAADVRYLLTLHDILDKRLQALGRTGWVSEECARLEKIRYAAPHLDTAFFSVNGAKNLDERGLAILKSLFMFREEEARRRHRPPFFVISDSSILFLAARPDASLSEVPGLGPNALQRIGSGLQQALRNGLAAPPVQKPPSVMAVHISRRQIQRLNRLKAWRQALGATLALDPSLLWPMSSLERLSEIPDAFEIEVNSGDLRRWQREQFAASLRTFLKSQL
jgi:ribonuclease D